MQRISALGLDVGKKRVGVAGCDRTGLISTPLTTLKRTSFQRDVEQLRQLTQEREVQVLVVGLPYSMDGTLGTQARQVQKFAQQLGNALQLPVEYVDERLTSIEAEEQLRGDRCFSPRRDKALIDAQAAAIILQQWLDQRRASSRESGEADSPEAAWS